MAKLLPANDARQLTELAKKKIAQEKRLARSDKETPTWSNERPYPLNLSHMSK